MRFDIRQKPVTSSTNDDVKQEAGQGAAEGLVVWALEQSAGRGRQGRTWQSPPGNLYFSVLLRPRVSQRDYGCYSFIAALAICDGIRDFLPANAVTLKWPNDVLVNGKKISGILLEAGENFLVAGMGVNIAHVPENPLYPVTALATETPDTPPLDQILNKILSALGHWCDTIENQDFTPIRAAWLARARKGPMRVNLPSGEIHGEFADLDAEGNLLLRLPDGQVRSINTGDVFF